MPKDTNIIIVFLMIPAFFIPLLVYLWKGNSKIYLQPIMKAFPGHLSIFSWFYTGTYKSHSFTVSFIGGRGEEATWKIALFLNPHIDYDAYIYKKNPGPVVFKTRLCDLPNTDDGPFVFSGQPEKAKYFMKDESNLNIIREIMEISLTEKAKKFSAKRRQIITPFIFKKTKLIANIVATTEPINPQLVQSCLDKMILLVNNLQGAA